MERLISETRWSARENSTRQSLVNLASGYVSVSAGAAVSSIPDPRSSLAEFDQDGQL